jgi:hypothetical protein
MPEAIKIKRTEERVKKVFMGRRFPKRKTKNPTAIATKRPSRPPIQES